MKILWNNARIWWLAVADEIRPRRGIPTVDAIKIFADEFRFAGVPTVIPADGIHRFKEGKLSLDDRAIEIKEAAIYNDGLSVEVTSDTNDAIIVVHRFIEVGKKIGLQEPVTPPRILYNSSMVCELDGNIDRLIEQFSSISDVIGNATGFVGMHHATAIELSVDPKNIPPAWGQLNPSYFRLERRVGVEFEKNRYFSIANTSTANHEAILQRIEQACSNSRLST